MEQLKKMLLLIKNDQIIGKKIGNATFSESKLI